MYKAATSISNITAPLLQFYSFSNLSKLLIILRNVKKTVESLDQTHGLKIILENESCNITLNDIKVKIERIGTFVELLNALDKKSQIDIYYENIFTLRELLDHNVDLYDFLENRNNILPIYKFMTYKVSPKDIQNINKKQNCLNINFINKKSFVSFESSYLNNKLFDFQPRTIKTSLDPIGYLVNYYYNDSDEFPNFAFERHYTDDHFIVGSYIKNGQKLLLYQIEILYMISYLYSNLVRYYPKYWDALRRKKNIFWDIEKSISYMYRSFPNYILNAITGTYTIIFSPGMLKRK